jgi:hypothetical protein
MSIGLLLEYAVPTIKSDVVPIATEEAFRKYWQPGCAALHLRRVPLFQTGLPLQQEDSSSVIEELVLLKEWLSCRMKTDVPQAVVRRIDHLIQALHKVQGDTQVAVYVG